MTMKHENALSGSYPFHVRAVSVAALVAATVVTVMPARSLATEITNPTAARAEALVEETAGALVTVSVTKAASGRRGLPLAQDDDPLGEFLHRFGEDGALPGLPFARSGRETNSEILIGSGVIIDSDGLIVTADALVNSADRIEVGTRDGRALAADLVGRDIVSGLAVLRVETSEALPSAGWSRELPSIGQSVLTVGRSEDFGPLVSSGLIAAIAADGEILIDDGESPALLGAPVLDGEGRVLAIRTEGADPASGMIVAVAAGTAEGLVDELADKGSVARGYLGVGIQPVTQDLASALGLERAHGAIVADLRPGTPAEAAGLRVGDVILLLDGETVAGPADLSKAVGDRDPGDAVSLGVLRDGDDLAIEVALAALPGSKTPAQELEGIPVPDLGVSVQELSPALREAFGLSQDAAGLVITEVDERVAEDLRTGDVIVSIYRDPVETAEDISGAASRARGEGRSSLLVLIDRDGARLFVPVPLVAS
jgi:serine protease Do